MCTFESFSEDLVPRVVPQPMLFSAQNNARPTVPEVSLIIDHSTAVQQNDSSNPAKPLSYKEWRQQQTASNENLITQDLIKKKSVTFANAVNPVNNRIPASVYNQNKTGSLNGPTAMPCTDLDLSLCDQRSTARTVLHQKPVAPAASVINVPASYTSSQPIYRDTRQISEKTHEKHDFQLNDAYRLLQFYQAQNGSSSTSNNEISSNQNASESSKEITMTDLYQLMLKTLQSQNQTDVPPVELPEQPQKTQPVQEKCMCQQIVPKSPASQGASPNLATASSTEPTVKDLFQIIVKQQEQLMTITKQLQFIMSMNQPRHEQPNPSLPQCNTNQMENQNFLENPFLKPSATVNSMGVMTSLEINVQKCNGHSVPHDNQSHFTNVYPDRGHSSKPRSSEGHCCCDCKTLRTRCQNVNGNNVSDSSNDSSCENQDEHYNLPNGMQKDNNLAFYGNILNQVNDVLKNSPPNALRSQRQQQYEDRQQPLYQAVLEQQRQQHGSDNAQFNSLISSNIRTAKFKQIGFQFDDVNISATSKRVTFNSDPMGNMTKCYQKNYNIQPSPSTEQSMLMNALARKYLPKDDSNTALPLPLASPTGNVTNRICHEFSTPPPPHGLTNNLNIRKSTSDTSLANYRYLEKYGLL